MLIPLSISFFSSFMPIAENIGVSIRILQVSVFGKYMKRYQSMYYFLFD